MTETSRSNGLNGEYTTSSFGLRFKKQLSKVGTLEELLLIPRKHACICQHENSHPSIIDLLQNMQVDKVTWIPKNGTCGRIATQSDRYWVSGTTTNQKFQERMSRGGTPVSGVLVFVDQVSHDDAMVRRRYTWTTPG
jgi:hypothetical protein